MRMIFTFLAACAFVALAAASPARAGTVSCVGPCAVLHAGHVRGRIPVACVSIPFVKEGYGEVAMFIMRDFDPTGRTESVADQLTDPRLLVHRPDSKVTGPVDDFCRNPKFFAGARWVVLCDEHHLGWIRGSSLQYAIRYGRPPKNRRVSIGSHV